MLNFSCHEHTKIKKILNPLPSQHRAFSKPALFVHKFSLQNISLQVVDKNNENAQLGDETLNSQG